jgi:branched-chain amino acid transport system substrate-binding protein
MFGNDALRGAQMAVEGINAQGGVRGGSKLELHVLDDAARPHETVTKIRQLSYMESVAILGPSHSRYNKLLSEVAESSGIPFFPSNPFRGGLPSAPPRYTFWIQPELGALAQQILDYLLVVAKVNNVSISSIGLFHDEYFDWKEAAQKTMELALMKGLRIVHNWTIPGGQTEAQLRGLAERLARESNLLNPDLIFILGSPIPTRYLVEAMQNVNFYPKAIAGVANQGVSSPAFVEQQGRLLVDVMDANYWGNPRSTLTGRFKTQYRHSFGTYPSNGAYHAFTAINVLIDAIIHCGSLDRGAIASALRQSEFSEHLLAQSGPIRFGERGQNINAEAVVLQVSNPVPIIIYPAIFSEGKVVFPLRKGS